jgi:hypothetical protein
MGGQIVGWSGDGAWGADAFPVRTPTTVPMSQSTLRRRRSGFLKKNKVSNKDTSKYFLQNLKCVDVCRRVGKLCKI